MGVNNLTLRITELQLGKFFKHYEKNINTLFTCFL
jgi:hypothetical protein